MGVTYRTRFNLTTCVNDYDKAAAYLAADDMAAYLKGDPRSETLKPEEILRCDWVLEDECSGYIECEFTRELTADELTGVSDWISGQASDGLGEGFSQQDFAWIPFDEDDEDSLYYDPYAGDGEMASFDWQTNNYELTKI